MHTLKLIASLGLAALGALAAAPAQAEKLSLGDMPRFCAGEASAELNARPQDISTDKAQRDGSGFAVYGQTPTNVDADKAAYFICHFDSAHRFVNLEVSMDGRARSGGGDRTFVDQADMQRFCQGEASAAFSVRPQDILTLPVERRKNGHFAVYGQYPQEGSDITTFVCTFGPKGGFERVKKS